MRELRADLDDKSIATMEGVLAVATLEQFRRLKRTLEGQVERLAISGSVGP